VSEHEWTAVSAQDGASVVAELTGIWNEREAFFQALVKIAWARDVDEARAIARRVLAEIAHGRETAGS
jgi:hypothetical protein